jgi:hypothetical protein
MVEARATRRAVAGALLLYAALWVGGMRRPAPNGDAISTWGTLAPHRSLLCVEEGPRLVLAPSPTRADREVVHAELETTEIRQGGAVGVVHRDHCYRASFSFHGWETPWMKNDYTSALPEWLPHLAFRLTRSMEAGRATTMLLGALALALCGLTAGRIGGWTAAAIAGGLLAVDPLFHVYKKIAGGAEVWLQLCAAGAMYLVARAVQDRAPIRLVPAALLVGVGLHVKPTFAAVAVPLILLSLPVLPWSALDRRGWRRVLAAMAVAGLVGASPALLYQATRPHEAGSIGWQESARARTHSLISRLLDGSSTDGDKGKDVPAPRLFLEPGTWLASYYDTRDRLGNEPGPREHAPPDRPPPLVQLGAVAAALLLGLAVSGAVARRGLVGWALGLGVAVPICVRVMHPDTHHLALALPPLTVALGAGAAAAVASRRARGAMLLVAAIACLGRGADLLRVDGLLDARVGRLLDRTSWPPLIDALLEEGATDPAVLDYEAMSLFDLHSGGRVRPFLYARAGGTRDRSCLPAGSDAWLGEILRAHRGGHLLILWGVDGIPTGAAATSWVDPARIASVARSAGLRVERRRELRDGRGRWYATLWAIHDR